MTWKATRTRPGYESFSLKVNGLKIDVFNGHVNFPGIWLLNCASVGMFTRKLYATDADEAKKKAVELVKNKLYAIAGELEHGTNEN